MQRPEDTFARNVDGYWNRIYEGIHHHAWSEAHADVYAALEVQARKTAARMIKSGAKRYLQHPKLLESLVPFPTEVSPETAIEILNDGFRKGWIRAWQYKSAMLAERYWRRFQ